MDGDSEQMKPLVRYIDVNPTSAPSLNITSRFLKRLRSGTEKCEESHEGLFTRDISVRAESRATVLGHRVDVPAFAMLEVDEDAHRGRVAPNAVEASDATDPPSGFALRKIVRRSDWCRNQSRRRLLGTGTSLCDWADHLLCPNFQEII